MGEIKGRVEEGKSERRDKVNREGRGWLTVRYDRVEGMLSGGGNGLRR